LLGKRTQDLAGKLDDFEFCAALTVAYYSSAFAFFRKKSEKSKINPKHIAKNTKWWN
jgi:hypothetical protein